MTWSLFKTVLVSLHHVAVKCLGTATPRMPLARAPLEWYHQPSSIEYSFLFRLDSCQLSRPSSLDEVLNHALRPGNLLCGAP